MRSLLVYRHGAIGDSLSLTPFLHSLRSRHQRLSLVGNAERLALIDERLWDEVLSWDLQHRRAAALAAEFDLSVAFTGTPIEGFTHVLPILPPAGENIYEWMRRAAIELGGESPEFRPDPSSGRGLIVHPGSGSPAKNAPLDYFLAEAARESEALFLLGPAEETTMDDRIHRAGFRTARPATLSELKKLLRRHARFLGNDSGPAHLAALNGLETRVVFLGSNPTIWAPPGAKLIHRAIFSATVHLEPIS